MEFFADQVVLNQHGMRITDVFKNTDILCLGLQNTSGTKREEDRIYCVVSDFAGDPILVCEGHCDTTAYLVSLVVKIAEENVVWVYHLLQDRQRVEPT